MIKQKSSANNGGKTGWPPGLLQDDHSRLSKWLANRPGALYYYKQQQLKEQTNDKYLQR